MLDAIREHYIRSRPLKKRRQGEEGKEFEEKIKFAWDNADDTSEQVDPLYKGNKVHMAFGRGYQVRVRRRTFLSCVTHRVLRRRRPGTTCESSARRTRTWTACCSCGSAR